MVGGLVVRALSESRDLHARHLRGGEEFWQRRRLYAGIVAVPAAVLYGAGTWPGGVQRHAAASAAACSRGLMARVPGLCTFRGDERYNKCPASVAPRRLFWNGCSVRARHPPRVLRQTTIPLQNRLSFAEWPI